MTTRRSGTCTPSPVRGLRAARRARVLVSNTPKSRSSKRSPSASLCDTVRNSSSMILPVSSLARPSLSATLATSSRFVVVTVAVSFPRGLRECDVTSIHRSVLPFKSEHLCRVTQNRRPNTNARSRQKSVSMLPAYQGVKEDSASVANARSRQKPVSMLPAYQGVKEDSASVAGDRPSGDRPHAAQYAYVGLSP